MLKLLTIKDFWRRSAVGFIVSIWILAPYAILQQFSLYQVWGVEVWLLEENLWDQMVPVNLKVTPIYFSYVLLLVIAGYYSDQKHFVYFLKSISIVALISHLTFFFIPTGLSRPHIELSETPLLYQWLVSVDLPRNCLPSLHASLAVLATLVLAKLHRILGWIAFFWTAAILWSALALRQHLSIDLAAGVILALFVWMIIKNQPKTNSKETNSY